MNILITCPGKKVETIDIFRNEFEEIGGNVIAAGNSNMLAGLHSAHKAYVVPSIHDSSYIPTLLNICKKEKISAILSLMDSDVLVLSKAIDFFKDLEILPIIVTPEAAEVCDNKLYMYKFLTQNNFKCARTYDSIDTFTLDCAKNMINFPVFCKPIIGDGSRGAMICRNMAELSLYEATHCDYIIQEFIDGSVIDIDVYVDMISGQMVSIFAKENTSKAIEGPNNSISIKDEKLFSLISDLVKKLALVGPIDIDVFGFKGEYYISEVNPRFGARYICAHGCGVNFIELIINNMKRIENIPNIGNYSSNILMMKYDKIMFLPYTEVL